MPGRMTARPAIHVKHLTRCSSQHGVFVAAITQKAWKYHLLLHSASTCRMRRGPHMRAVMCAFATTMQPGGSTVARSSVAFDGATAVSYLFSHSQGDGNRRSWGFATRAVWEMRLNRRQEIRDWSAYLFRIPHPLHTKHQRALAARHWFITCHPMS